MHITTVAAPALLLPEDLTGATAIVIDALRMTSAAAMALENGCIGLLAVAEVEEARAIAAKSDALLGGERGALQIEGFDFSNSPRTFTRERVLGRRLVMTTTNGTRAIAACAGAERLLLAAFVNVGTAANAVGRADRVTIVCAGTNGRFSLEDGLAAGALAERLMRRGAATCCDMTRAMHALYITARADLRAALSGTAHYQRLVGLSLFDDLADCLTEDSCGAVPERGADGWFV